MNTSSILTRTAYLPSASVACLTKSSDLAKAKYTSLAKTNSLKFKCEQTATKNKTWEKLNMKKAKERCLTGNYTAKKSYEE